MTSTDASQLLCGLVLAAGGSTRFGSPKALALFQGEPLVLRAARLLLACCPAGVTVVTGAHGEDVRAALRPVAGPALSVVSNPAWAEGLAGSLRCGLLAAPAGAAATLVLPCDLPAVTAGDLDGLIAAWAAVPGRIAAAAFAGGPGPPAILPRVAWAACEALTGDRGAHALILAASDHVEVPMPAAALDVDTPAALAALEARRAAGHAVLK